MDAIDEGCSHIPQRAIILPLRRVKYPGQEMLGISGTSTRTVLIMPDTDATPVHIPNMVEWLWLCQSKSRPKKGENRQSCATLLRFQCHRTTASKCCRNAACGLLQLPHADLGDERNGERGDGGPLRPGTFLRTSSASSDRRLENQSVVHLEDEPGAKTFGSQPGVDRNHGLSLMRSAAVPCMGALMAARLGGRLERACASSRFRESRDGGRNAVST